MKLIFIMASLLLTSSVFAHGVGQSTYPLITNKKLISTEFVGVLSDGSSIGIQARYTQKINKKTYLDAGLGIGGSNRPSTAFVGVDYEILPDFNKQPKFSLKMDLTNAKEFNHRKNIIGITPIASKGFNFWGREAYPYFAIPLSLDLDSNNKTYNTAAALTVGLSSKVPFNGYKHLTANIEGRLNLSDSYSAVFAGVSFPLN